MKTFQIAAAALSLTLTGSLFAASSARAAEPAPHSIEVRYDDLDLTTAKGQKTLQRRVERAARDACHFDDKITGTMLRSNDSIICYHSALAQATDHVAAAVKDDNFGG